jgi:integrase
MPENPPKTTLPALTTPVLDPAQGLPGHLEALAETARDYARGAKAPATQRAYASDWRHYTTWCQRKGLNPLPPDPRVIGLYLAACVSGQAGSEKASPVVASSVRTVERRLSAITWHCAQCGEPLDRADRHIAEVMKGIRRQHGKPPSQKEAVLAEDLLRMIETLGRDLRGLRDRAILLVGFAGGLRRSEITRLDWTCPGFVESCGLGIRVSGLRAFCSPV